MHVRTELIQAGVERALGIETKVQQTEASSIVPVVLLQVRYRNL